MENACACDCHEVYDTHIVHTISTTNTVEPPITDTPNSGPCPYNRQRSMYQLLFLLTQYIYSSRIADNLRIPDNGRVSCTERHFPKEAHLQCMYNRQRVGLSWAELLQQACARSAQRASRFHLNRLILRLIPPALSQGCRWTLPLSLAQQFYCILAL